MDIEILQTLNRCIEANEPVALVTVIANTGSSPGKAGAMMSVQSDKRICGTIGGGNLEFQAIDEAVSCLASGKSKEVSYALKPGGDLGMTCGGELRIFIRIFKAQSQLIIVGGGHIGLELYQLAVHQGFQVTVIDDREEIVSPQRFPHANRIFTNNIVKTLQEFAISPNSYITIASRSHDTDRQALEAVVTSNAAYIGMIGSRNKIRLTLKHLINTGVSRENVAAVYAPMGLNIASIAPKEIAVSIISEILLVKNDGSPQHMRTVKDIEY